MGNISFLLGAGFSVNQGYPTAYRLAQAITSLQYGDFIVSAAGNVGATPDGKDIWTLGSYKLAKECVLELIKLFEEREPGNFNYEEFYDFLALTEETDFSDAELAILRKYISKDAWYKDLLNLRSDLIKIFTQIVSWKISDGGEDKFYSSNVVTDFSKNKYAGFLELVRHFKSEGKLFNFHTLNHDLFLESLRYTDEFGGEMSDGFTDDTEFYEDSDGYEKKLSKFTDKYPSNIRLFKLHGSFEIIAFRGNGRVTDYIKFPWRTDLTNIKKRKSQGDILDFTNYHSDFLSGTMFKKSRYSEPLYFGVMLDHFGKNLEQCDKLIIIGYGCLDSGINEIIEEKLRAGIPIYVVDPYPSNDVKEFVNKKGAILIVKTPENITLKDFDEK
ncbi:hypothetical protein ACR780_02480 [Sphingobacterium faecium]|uniref:hypothetical protein n=1 Tax=Sphingobacterium faecium TaxID=34087 RepID=UPI003DA47E12